MIDREMNGLAIDSKFTLPAVNNPHLHHVKNLQMAPAPPFRFVHELTSRRQYKKLDPISYSHSWYDRSVLMSELQFLSDHHHLFDPNRPGYILYIGSGTGVQLRYLARLYPELQFHLYDPLPPLIPLIANISFHQEYFTDELASAWANVPNLMMICGMSNIDSRHNWNIELRRKNGFKVLSQSDYMSLQKRWYENVRPIKSMLRFEFPFSQQKAHYPAGQFYLPIWGGKNWILRLVPDGFRDITHDLSDIDEKMAFFNARVRPLYYSHDVDCPKYFDHCFDCAAEIAILRRNIRLGRHSGPVDKMAEEINRYLCVRSRNTHTVFTRQAAKYLQAKRTKTPLTPL